MELPRSCLGIRAGLLGFTWWCPRAPRHRRSSVLTDGTTTELLTPTFPSLFREFAFSFSSTSFLLLPWLVPTWNIPNIPTWNIPNIPNIPTWYDPNIPISNIPNIPTWAAPSPTTTPKTPWTPDLKFVTNLQCALGRNSFTKKIFRGKNHSLESNRLLLCMCVYNSYPGQYLDY